MDVTGRSSLAIKTLSYLTCCQHPNKQLTKDQKIMIEALKSDEIVHKVGGRFKLTALIQKRMLELMDGARPLVDKGNLTDLEVVIQEILQNKIAIDYEASGLDRP